MGDMDVPPIHRLPTELLQIVHDELSPEDGRCLRLTCWDLRLKVNPGPWTRADQKKWTLPLEQNCSDGLLCHNCYRFHGFSNNFDKEFREDHYVHQPHLECGKTQGAVKLGTRWLKFSHIQLLMNRQRWGPEHGLPLGALSIPYDISPPPVYLVQPDQFRMRQQWKAKTFQNQLYLKGEYIISGCMSDLVTILDSKLHIKLCQHRTTEFAAVSHLCRRISEPITNPSAWPNQNSRVFPLQSCEFCYTDYVVTLGYHPQGGVHCVRFETWHRVGECASPGDRCWLAMASRDVMMTMSFKRDKSLVSGKRGNVRWIFEMAEYLEGR